MSETLGLEDFVDCEVVVQEEKTGEKRGRPSTLYREDRFFVHFPDAKKRKSLFLCFLLNFSLCFSSSLDEFNESTKSCSICLAYEVINKLVLKQEPTLVKQKLFSPC